MVDEIRVLESRREKYNQQSISLCSDNEVNECFDGAGSCSGGTFDSNPGATYLWKLRGEEAIVKQIVVTGD